MSICISPVFGEISEDIYNLLVTLDYDMLIEEMKKRGYGRLRTGVLYLESINVEQVVLMGSEIINMLEDYGFNKSDAVDVTRVFSVNGALVNELISRGFKKESVVYGLDFKNRLTQLGLKRRTVTSGYAIREMITVYPMLVVKPKPKMCFRSQATFTYSTGKKTIEMRVWYQSDIPITELELTDKWNEANENAISLPGNLEPLLDTLEPSPGFELNYTIYESEIVGEKNIWYGLLIFTDRRSGNIYEYKVL
jgi:hypothetical protein